MDASQVTGATSSYARKYALNGLFCIDDVKDAERGDGLIYDLHGRRIDNHVKGVCIINGKKVFIK